MTKFTHDSWCGLLLASGVKITPLFTTHGFHFWLHICTTKLQGLGAAFGAGTDAPSDGEPAASEHAHVQAVMAEAALPGQPAASTAEEQAGGGEPGGGAEAADGGRARTGGTRGLRSKWMSFSSRAKLTDSNAKMSSEAAKMAAARRERRNSTVPELPFASFLTSDPIERPADDADKTVAASRDMAKNRCLRACSFGMIAFCMRV